MDVDEEVESNRKLDERKNKLQNQLRYIEKVTDMDPIFMKGQKEKWQQELQEIVSRSADH